MRSLPWNAVYWTFLHSSWMLTDKLKLNKDKTEFMLIGTKQQLSKINFDSLTVGSIDVAPVTVARNLGTWFDSNLNLQGQIHNTCKSEFFHLYNIWRIRKYLSQESARTLVHAFIIGRIDYCNSLLFGLPSVHLLKLQRLQNAAARLISNVPRYSHITPVLWSLHWLRVKFRIDFKILLLTFKPIYGHAPGYSIDLIAIKEQPRDNFRSVSGLILKYPGLKLEKTFGTVLFHLLPLIYGTIYHSTSVLWTISNVLNLYFKVLIACGAGIWKGKEGRFWTRWETRGVSKETVR